MQYLLRPGMRVSHRNPFHGYGVAPEDSRTYIKSDIYDYDVSALDRNLIGVQGYGADFLSSDTFSKVEPILKGLLTGLATYVTAKVVGVVPQKATRLGIVVGGLEIATIYLTRLIKNAGSTTTVTTPGA